MPSLQTDESLKTTWLQAFSGLIVAAAHDGDFGLAHHAGRFPAFAVNVEAFATMQRLGILHRCACRAGGVHVHGYHVNVAGRLFRIRVESQLGCAGPQLRWVLAVHH